MVIESYLISHCSSRILEVMVGPEGCQILYDRRQGSDLCESLFSRCVSVMGQDKVSKRAWLRMFSKIARQAERQLMSPDARGHPMFSAQNRVYQDKAFQAGFRCCACYPQHCVIGGACARECACSAESRHARERAKMRARGSAHAERSTRTRFNKYKDEGSSSDAPAAPPPPDDDIADSVLAAVDAMSDGGSDDEQPEQLNRALDF